MRPLARLAALSFLVLTIAASATPASAGTVALAWDAVTDTDLAGYRVYYGSAPGNYTQSVDVGNVTSTTISGLADCQTWYFGVKAYDTAGNESTNYSNEISGWGRPTVATSAPSAAEQGRTLALTITGSNFQSGASVIFSNAGITVNSVTVNSCTQLTANVTVGNAAAVGASNIEVDNPDQVYGTGTGLFTVQATVAPTVSSTTPTNGATGISITVKPTVVFSEAMLPASITATNVKLLNDTGAAVAQAAGSPSLSTDGLTATITPAASLTQGKVYKIQVVGGATGVLDLANHGMATTFTQATGFTTAADTTPPVISAVASSGVGSTTATITWTTDEASDSQVFYRKSSQTGYQQDGLDTALVTSHSEPLTGLAPSTTYTYYVRSVDGAGNASQSTTKTFTTTANSFSYLSMEAESAAVVAPMRVVNGATGVFGGSYVDTPTGTAPGSATAPSGTATYGVSVPSSGTWYLWVRMYGIDGTTDSIFESVNGAARQAIFTPHGVWTWSAGRSYTLTAGLASIELGGRDPQVRADRVLLTNDPTFVPTEQPVDDQTVPNPVTSFAGVGGTGQVALTWTNSSSTDLAQVVIRVRTDGKFPTSPVDGAAVLSRAATASSADSYTQTGLTTGTTYYYSAFAVDASGNVSLKATVSAIAQDTTKPGNVQNVKRTDKH